MSRTGVCDDDILIVSVVVDGALDRVPGVLDVVEVPPEIAGVYDGGVVWRHPAVGLVHRPAARVDHWPTGLVKPVAKLRITLQASTIKLKCTVVSWVIRVMSSFLCPLVLWVDHFRFKLFGMVKLYFVHIVRMGIAAVQLDVVYAPGLECLGVFLEVSEDAGVASTGVVPVVLIYTELETLRVDIVAESLDAAGEPRPVRLEVAASAHNTTALLYLVI